ncbi:MAG: hypothetical protein NUV85_01155 [Candidatus Berkelbacteria bacterium]|nr:hypothetical protein [Candidatus Berkelbacteria bacterium]
MILPREPSALRLALRSAKVQLYTLNAERNVARWIALLYEVHSLLKEWTKKDEMVIARLLFRDRWRLLSDWPLRPSFYGEPVFTVKLGKRLGGGDYMSTEFAWDVQQDARPVPIDQVYQLLGLSDDLSEEQELSWKVCFWLALLSESELHDLAMAKRR